MLPTPRAARRAALLALATLMLLGLPAAPAAAHVSADHGTAEIRDTQDGPATSEVHCEFWVAGVVDDDEGWVHFTSGETTSAAPWNAHSGNAEDGFAFLVGGLGIVGEDSEAVVTLGPDVPDLEDPGLHALPALPYRIVEGCEQVTCPRDLTATANPDGRITLDWEPEEGSPMMVSRQPDDAAFQAPRESPVAARPPLVDTTAQPGVTYTYTLVFVGDESETPPCEGITVTAIPFFSGPLGALAVGTGALAAFAALRRRA